MRPVSSLEVMRTAVDAIIDGIFKDISSLVQDSAPGPNSASAAALVYTRDSAPTQESGPTQELRQAQELRPAQESEPVPDFVPAISGFSVTLSGIASTQAKPSPLFHGEASAKPKAIPVALKLALFGLEEKFGDRTVTWGKKTPSPRGSIGRSSAGRRCCRYGIPCACRFSESLESFLMRQAWEG